MKELKLCYWNDMVLKVSTLIENNCPNYYLPVQTDFSFYLYIIKNNTSNISNFLDEYLWHFTWFNLFLCAWMCHVSTLSLLLYLRVGKWKEVHYSREICIRIPFFMNMSIIYWFLLLERYVSIFWNQYHQRSINMIGKRNENNLNEIV